MSQPTFIDGLGYEGKVTLTLKSNNRVLKSQTYKNQGTAYLFRFLGLCLAGEFNQAKNLLPNKILLLYNNNGVKATNGTGSTQGAEPANAEVRSAWQSYTQIPSVVSDSNTESVKVVYSFEVPRHTIAGIFNQVALYSSGVASEKDFASFSAFYYLVDDDQNFDDQDPSVWSPSTVLLIEWELTISNKNTEAINTPETNTPEVNVTEGA